MPQCGTSARREMTLQPAQNPGEWRRYITHFRAPSLSSDKRLQFVFHCTAVSTQTAKQTVFFDDLVMTPVAPC